MASTRREQESQATTKPFYENAFFWGTIVSWLVIVGGGVRYCQVSGKGLKENLLLDNLQEQQVTFFFALFFSCQNIHTEENNYQ